MYIQSHNGASAWNIRYLVHTRTPSALPVWRFSIVPFRRARQPRREKKKKTLSSVSTNFYTSSIVMFMKAISVLHVRMDGWTCAAATRELRASVNHSGFELVSRHLPRYARVTPCAPVFEQIRSVRRSRIDPPRRIQLQSGVAK